MLALKQDGRRTKGSSARNYRVYQMDAAVTTEGAPLSRVRIEGDDKHPFFRPLRHRKLGRDDLPSARVTGARSG
jgi:hypothetical protein